MTIGLHHIEFWVADLRRSLQFYEALFGLLGWTRDGPHGFRGGGTEIYFVERPVRAVDGAGPRHLCFRASSRETVDAVGRLVRSLGLEVIRGPVEVPAYHPGYHTVDFRDPDGYVLEVAFDPTT